MEELRVEARIENLEKVQAFIKDKLEKVGCPLKTIMEIDVAVEEIYVNISNYAYKPMIGDATICCEVKNDPLQVTIQFLDKGRFFNPLEKEDADISLSVDERPIGGLGVFMVKKIMDEVEYSYRDNKNILTIKKNL